jgi:hypothetical protein
MEQSMTGIIEVKGRPAWAASEPIAVQALIVEYRLNKGQVAELRAFADNSAGVDQPRLISYSRARALANRDFGDISGKNQPPGTMSRAHPQAVLRLNERGMKLAVALAEGARRAGGETSAAGAE